MKTIVWAYTVYLQFVLNLCFFRRINVPESKCSSIAFIYFKKIWILRHKKLWVISCETAIRFISCGPLVVLLVIVQLKLSHYYIYVFFNILSNGCFILSSHNECNILCYIVLLYCILLFLNKEKISTKQKPFFPHACMGVVPCARFCAQWHLSFLKNEAISFHF